MNRVAEERITTADLADQVEAREESHPVQEESTGPLFASDAVQDFRTEWDRVQTAFVDDPRSAVKQADELVARAIKRLAESFAEQRSRLEDQWVRGDDVSTEDLRLALRRYRAFFQRLLAV
jgi:hypothetical protein